VRILTICPFYYPSLGGVEQTAKMICDGLVRRGHYVEVWTSDVTSGRPRQHLGRGIESINGVTVVRLRTLHWASAPQTVGVISPGFFRAALGRNQEFDVIHLHVYSGFSAYSQLLSDRRRSPALILSAYTGFDTALPRGIYDRTIGRLLVRRVARVICMSHDEAGRFIRLGANPHQMVILPSGADPGLFQVNDGGSRFRSEYKVDGPYVLFVGRLAANKGLRILIKAMQPLLVDHPDTSLILAGDDSGEGKSIDKLVASAGLWGRIRRIGAVPESTLPSAYAGSSVVALPSTFGESLGMVLIEAMAAGKPVVATRTGGILSVVRDNENGLLVEPGDVVGLGSALRRLIEQPHLAARLARSAADEAHLRAWPPIVTRLESIYEEVRVRNPEGVNQR
jgi:phosphatidylinositol alpha-mannosyltransferase